jgi:hypothetical protein
MHRMTAGAGRPVAAAEPPHGRTMVPKPGGNVPAPCNDPAAADGVTMVFDGRTTRGVDADRVAYFAYSVFWRARLPQVRVSHVGSVNYATANRPANFC